MRDKSGAVKTEAQTDRSGNGVEIRGTLRTHKTEAFSEDSRGLVSSEIAARER